MSANVGEIDLSLILNSGKFNSQLKNVDKQANNASSKISSSLSKIGKAAIAAFSIAAVSKFGKECLNVATETSNAWIGLNSILVGQGKNFDNAKNFINEYISDGLVPLNNAVTTYKNLALRGYNSEQIEKTMNALKNSATFARQSTYSLGDAVQTASEGLKNENSVVVDNAGVTKNVAKMWEDYAKKIGKTTNNLTQQEKIQAEVNGILEETKFQSNDAAKYTETYSGKVAKLNTAFTNFKTVIGNVVQPLASLFVPAITVAINAVTKLFTALSALLALFGLKADSVETVSSGMEDLTEQAGGASDAVSDVGDSAKKAGKDAKKASNNLAAFDKLDVLKKDTDSSSGTGSGSGGNAGGTKGFTDKLDVSSKITEDTSAFDGLINRVKELANIFRKGFDASFGDTNFDGILKHLNNIKSAIIDIWTDTKVVNSAQHWVDVCLYSLGQITGSVSRIGINIAENLIGSIDKYLSQNKDRIKKFICDMFDISSEDMTLTGNLWQSLGEISDIFSSDTAKQIGADIIAMFANPFMSAIETCSKFVKDIKAILFQPIIDNTERIKEAFNNTLNPIQAVTGTLAEAMTYIGDKWNEVYDTHISPLMESLKTGLSDTFGKFLDVYNQYVAPMLQRMSEKFNELWNDHLKPVVDKIGEYIKSIADAITALWNNVLKPVADWIIANVIPVIVPIFEGIWNTICKVFGSIADTIGGIIETFTGLINFVVGIFTGDWNKAWNGIKTFFSGIWNTIKGIVSTVWNAIYGKISKVINTIKAIITTIFNAIKTVISNVFNGIRNTVSNIINKVKTVISNVLNTIKNIWNKIWTGLKTTVTNIFDGIWKAIKKVINSILGGIEGMANGVIKGINTIINALNKLKIDIPDWVPEFGGKQFGFDIKKIQEIHIKPLAQGGYVKANTPQLAIVGDNKRQGEIIAPEDKIVENNLKALRMFFKEMGDMKNNNEPINLYLNFKGDIAQLARVLKPELDRESKRKGNQLILGGAKA